MFFLYGIKKLIKSVIKPSHIKKGRRVYIDPTCSLIGKANISIGDNSIIGEYVWFNVNHRDTSIRLDIGKNCLIGRNSFVTTGKLVKIGCYFLGGINCRILGANHDYNDPCIPYIKGFCTDDSSIIIGANVWFGTDVTVLGNVTIGYGSIIGANALVTKDLPPFSVAVGSPAKVIKRFDFNQKEWINVSDYIENRDLPTEEEYIRILEQNYSNLSLPLEAVTRRFGGL